MPLTNFPTSLDSWTGKTDNSDDVLAAHVNKLQDAIEALETKLGIDSSATVTTIEYILKNASSSNPGHVHLLAAGATDVTATKDEINSVVDGCTATAAEINTVADGSNLLTLTLPASTTISAFGKTVVDDANAATVRTTIGAPPISHAANASTYGYGDGTNAGHLRVGSGLTQSTGTVSHTAHTGDVTGATALTIGASKVTQSMLKTSTSTDSDTATTNQQNGTSLLTGGEYGFMVQAKGNDANMKFAYGYTEAAKITDSTTGYASATYAGPYITWGWIRTDGATNHVFYLQQRYVTSSGEVNWLFILRDKDTKKVRRVNFASDHPCFGHGGDPVSRPHPWVGCNAYDPETMEIIVINPTDKEIEGLLSEYPDCENMVEVFHNYLEVDETDTPWPNKKVTVGLPKGTNWKSVESGTPVIPLKKIIPKPEHIKVKSLKRK